MATSYSTPGVYVVEKSLFPPSVAQVETAVPAFIGYVEKAMDKKVDDLLMTPKKIESLLEYEKYFGKGPEKVINLVEIGADDTVVDVDIPQKYYLYDAIRLFYSNGGGKCYITAVGKYDPVIAVSLPLFTQGLDAVKKKDEPTILLFPDAVSLPVETDLYTLQIAALAQCAELQDRVGVFDTYYGKEDKTLFDTSIDNLRNNIGVNNLKYGAVYTPWLKSSLPRDFTYADIYNKLVKLGAPIILSSLVSSSNVAVQNLLADYDILLADRLRMLTVMETLLGVAPTLDANMLDNRNREIREAYETELNTFKTAAAAGIVATARNSFRNLVDLLFFLLAAVDDMADVAVVKTVQLRNDILLRLAAIAATTDVTNPVLLDNIIGQGASGAPGDGYFGANTGYRRHVIGPLNPAVVGNWHEPTLIAALQVAAVAPDTMFPNNSATAGFGTFANPLLIENLRASEAIITKAFVAYYQLLQEVLNSLASALDTKENSLYSSFLLYKDIIDYVNRELTILPPSGAIAGIYAYVDATRGVWKAPANVSLSNVKSVSIELTDKDQEPLNIDVNSGKSVNVIRPFTGKGIMVWGSRTLAGNDNEWRYVPVRRFFNMVEESVKKSTFWAVFEPNDANTWSKVKGMIDNFLTLQWRNGALQGAKPNDAFFVKIGLGQTMTAQDILEGRMNVEIGMAVVRPAEFIILTFSHLMATSS